MRLTCSSMVATGARRGTSEGRHNLNKLNCARALASLVVAALVASCSDGSSTPQGTEMTPAQSEVAQPTPEPTTGLESAAPSGTEASPDSAALEEVLALVTAATAIQSLPADLRPSLEDAADDSGGVMAAERVGCYPQDAEVSVPGDCVWGDKASSQHVMLIGDSHAAMWLTAFDELGKRVHWQVLLYSKISCPPLDQSFYNFNRQGAYPECDRWHEYIAQEVARVQPLLVVLTGDTRNPKDSNYEPISRDQWRTGLSSMVAKLGESASKVAILGDIPRVGKPPFDTSGPECLAAHAEDVQACSSSAAEVADKLYVDVERGVAEAQGALYIDVFPWFCTDRCSAVIGNFVVYRNASHITATYATYLSGVLEGELRGYVEQ